MIVVRIEVVHLECPDLLIFGFIHWHTVVHLELAALPLSLSIAIKHSLDLKSILRVLPRFPILASPSLETVFTRKRDHPCTAVFFVLLNHSRLEAE
jgi:hypothetical protein